MEHKVKDHIHGKNRTDVFELMKNVDFACIFIFVFVFGSVGILNSFAGAFLPSTVHPPRPSSAPLPTALPANLPRPSSAPSQEPLPRISSLPLWSFLGESAPTGSPETSSNDEE